MFIWHLPIFLYNAGVYNISFSTVKYIQQTQDVHLISVVMVDHNLRRWTIITTNPYTAKHDNRRFQSVLFVKSQLLETKHLFKHQLRVIITHLKLWRHNFKWVKN